MKKEINILDNLQDQFDSYSRSHQVLARFIIQHYQKVAFMGIEDLSESSGVSNATIVRFAKALGYNGYPSLQKEIRRIVRLDLSGRERFKTALAESEGEDVLNRIINKELENLSELKEKLKNNNLHAVVEAISAASEVVVIGARSTASLSQHLSFALKKLEIKTHRITSVTSETYDELFRIDKKALIIVIGFPRYLNELISVMNFCRSQSLKTLAITDSPLSPLQGDFNLYTPVESISFIAFHCAPLVLINLIITEMGLSNEDRTVYALNRFENLANQKKLFERSSVKRPPLFKLPVKHDKNS